MRELSLMERFVRLPAERRAALLSDLDSSRRLRLMRAWRWTARPAQLAPPGDWGLWVILAGRAWATEPCGCGRRWAVPDGVAQRFGWHRRQVGAGAFADVPGFARG